MLPDESAAPVDALQRQLRSVVDAQLSAFSVQYAAALDDARRRAREEAERAFAVKVDAIREEWTARLDAELRAARADADRRTEQRVADVRAESERHATNSIALAKLEAERSAAEAVAQARVEAERKASEAIAQARAEAERAADERIALMRVEAERRADDAIGQARAEAERAIAQATAQARAEADEDIARAREDAERRIADAIASANLDAEREAAEAIAQARLEADLHVADSLARTREELERTIAAERIRAENAIAGERDRAESALAAREAEAAAARQTVRAVVAAVRALDHSTSLTHALETLTEHAAAVAGRAAVFVLSGDRLSSFRMAGFPSTNGSPYETSLNGAGLLSNAVRTREMQTSNLDVPPPAFAGIAADHVAVAAPLSVGERVVAVVYADAAAGALDVYGAKSHAPASHRDWVDAIDAMARHASLVLGAVTAARTVQAAGVRNGESGAQPAIVDDEQRARRYARLLLSEIKLYHEPAIRAGRQQRDLLQRLRPEIDRARRLYEARVPPAIGPRATYFQQELVQTLADGDAALLGTAV